MNDKCKSKGAFTFVIFICTINIVNRSLHQQLLQQGITHDYIERPGEHNWPYWTNAVEYQMLFFHRYFAKSPVPAVKRLQQAAQ